MDRLSAAVRAETPAKILVTGTLYVVATPIGNLKDVSARAVETLKSVDVIACEDTRQTGKLLHHLGISKPMVSLHDHNERARAPQLIEQLKSGQSIALVSDGGTPLVSDPGWLLVRNAIDAGITVSWIPGPSALIGALVLSGLPTERFIFEGFLPSKSGQRRKRLEALKDESRTVVLYESPHRVVKTLHEIRDTIGDVQAACARELTKMFEEVRRGSVSELIAHFSATGGSASGGEQKAPKGEFVVVFSNRHSSIENRQ